MKSILRRRPSPALVISCIALFVSLGGVSYGVATGFIDSREIKNNSVRSADLRNNQIRSSTSATQTSREVMWPQNTLTGADISEQDLGKVPSAFRGRHGGDGDLGGDGGVRGVGGRRDAQDLQLAGPARQQLRRGRQPGRAHGRGELRRRRLGSDPSSAGQVSGRALRGFGIRGQFRCRGRTSLRAYPLRSPSARATRLGRSPTPAPTASS